ncbi:hypothetical protein [Bradyrhizobium sp. 2S1]|uniref:hypothetical protein n=1 Tax=Bradyrhizobium sp. 2S1 TaxID=1404429 RepID=UPI00140C5A58|nr:hypothetical protein [Bradyrhizobium sp. 2S1]MCK7673898.1 hypothetical protein [Bradyrhizobium sp. 2S1]
MNTPSPWLAKNLADERWFGDGQPNWKYLPSVEKAQIERQQRVRLLKKHGHLELMTVLAACAPGTRCLSGCCPECGRAMQRFVATKASQLLTPYNEYDVASIIGRTQRLQGNLRTLPAAKFRDHLLRTLRRGRAGLALGGIDFSFNEFPATDRLARPIRESAFFWSD